jgi:hypothetical protein
VGSLTVTSNESPVNHFQPKSKMCIHGMKVSQITCNLKVKAVPSAVKDLLLFSKTQ